MFSRRLLVATPTLRGSILPRPAAFVRPLAYMQYSSGLQNVAQPSFWASLIPKPLRRTSSASKRVKKPKSKEWNPATFYIVVFLLIGSMSIQMIALRNSFAAFSRRADAKIELLREVIERVRKGEEVDVEGLLGTGDPEKEKEWEEVLKEIEDEEALWTELRRKKPKLLTEAKGSDFPATKQSTDSEATTAATELEAASHKTNSNTPPGFY